jgi:cysteinyl-tRNA synthetase
MALRVYNTLSKDKELFEPVRPGCVGMYLCGPTVYKSPHIGHMVGPVIFDAIKRYLTYKGYEVTLVVNITDVDDKLINAANKVGVSMKELAERHTAEYHECLAAFGITTIDKFPKASEHMPEIIEMCQKLIEDDFAYIADGNVWFDVTKDEDYGKLSNRRPQDQESTGRSLEGSGKRNPADFALWKAAKAGEPSWDSTWGKGRPGWHIECSAMSMKYLGPTFDMHGGGMDLLFPHHENELAQSESATGQPFVHYWMHNGLTRLQTKAAGGQVQTDDIHETSGNAATVRAKDLLARHGAELLRYLLLTTHYRRPIEFTEEAMTAAKKGLSVFARLFDRVQRLTGQPLTANSPDIGTVASALLETPHAPFVRDVLNLKIKFLEMMDDDFNTAGAIAVLHELAGAANSVIERDRLEDTPNQQSLSAVAGCAVALRNLGRLLGLFSVEPVAKGKSDGSLTEQLMQLLIRLRADARKNKNFALADAIRDELIKIGVTLEDRSGGTAWRQE